MSHPTDGDRFATPQPQDDAWASPQHSQPEAPEYDAPQAPQYGAQQYEAPQYEAPPYSAPQHEYSQDDPTRVSTPASQPTPATQPSPVTQPSPMGQPSPMPYGASASQPSPAPQGGTWTPSSQKRGEANFFTAMVDFKFNHFITVKFSAFLYIVAFVVAGLLWLAHIVGGIMFGSFLGSVNSFFGEPSFNAVPLVLAILFGWIPSVIALIVMRVGLEFSVATVRTAQNTTRLAEAADASR